MMESIQLGDSVEHAGVVIAPLFPCNQPAATYITLDQALLLGFEVGELGESGSVPELVVHTPLQSNVLYT